MFQLFLDTEQPGGNVCQRYTHNAGNILIGHVLQPQQYDCPVKGLQPAYPVVQHLNLPALGIVIVVEVDVDGDGNRLYITFLPPYLIVAGVKAHTPYPRTVRTLSAELRKTLPQVDQYLLEQVIHLIRILGEEVADRIYGLPVLLNHSGKLKFNVVHQCFSFVLPFRHQIYRFLSEIERNFIVFIEKRHSSSSDRKRIVSNRRSRLSVSERTRLSITPDCRKTLVFSRKSQVTCLQGSPPVHGRRPQCSNRQ